MVHKLVRRDNKDEVVLYRSRNGFAVEEGYYSSGRQGSIRQLLDDFVVLELDKFNAIVTAHSIGEIRKAARNQFGIPDPSNPGYRLIATGDV